MRTQSTDIASFSYTPYSNNPEFCYILGQSGVWYPGVRVENISFPLTIPAVQAAICSCLGNSDQPVALSSNQNQKTLQFWIEKFDLSQADYLAEDAPVFDPLIKKVESINQSLKKLCEFTVSPESDFPVTALLVTEEGFIPGVNVEFEDWNLGLCAERVALSRALASGYSTFLGMHIYAPKSDFISPCGACRQMLFELMPSRELELHHDDRSMSRHLVSHLLPNGFTSSSLKK